MEISLQEKRVRLSVGEFACYREGPEGAGPSGGFSDPRRMQIGVQWHETLRAEAQKQTPQARFESAINTAWSHRGWTFEFQGRVDQLIPETNRLTVREVKSVSIPLPQPAEDIRVSHPEFFRQLSAYVCLLSLDEQWRALPVVGELVCVDIRSGIRQSVFLDEPAEQIFVRQLDRMIPFLEDRFYARSRLGALDFKGAFETLREGQQHAQAALKAALQTARITAFEAPTGFGKTGLLLEAGLRQLRDGRFSRLIYLTGKSTGQLAVMKQLARMTLGDALRFYQMRNRQEHAIHSPGHTCTEGGRCEQEDAALRWEHSNIKIPELFHSGSVSLGEVRAIGEKIGVCPYEISRAILPYADVWVCDYNYVFVPGSRGFLGNLFGFSPKDTLLVVDEAHNLPGRVADAFSQRLTATALLRIRDLLALAGAPLKTRTAAKALAEFLEGCRPCERMGLTELYELENLIEALDTAIGFSLGQMSLDDPLVQYPDVWEHLFAPAQWLDFLRNDRIRKLVWSPTEGEISLSCLDAAREIAAVTKEFGAIVFASATLSPAEDFARRTGADASKIAWVTAKAPWHEGAFRIAIDARADTRLSQRERYFQKTAQTVSEFSQGVREPVAVFFPSYRYAQNVAQYLKQTDPFLRVAVQPRGLDLARQTEFIEESLLVAHAIFLVLGSGYAEGIDLLGGRVRRAMVVGPALPEVNAVQRANMQAWEESVDTQEAFRQVYQLPAMRKINQALGRLVRAPGQKATVLLHCRRFEEAPYRALLTLPCPEIPVLRNDAQWADWLAQKD